MMSSDPCDQSVSPGAPVSDLLPHDAAIRHHIIEGMYNRNEFYP